MDQVEQKQLTSRKKIVGKKRCVEDIPDMLNKMHKRQQSTSKENDVSNKQCIKNVPDILNEMHELSSDDDDDSIRDKDCIPLSDFSDLEDSLNNGKHV